MRLFGVAVFGFLMLGSATASAQQYLTPEYNGCIRSFFDPALYNWLSYENTCSQSLSVVFVPNQPGHGGGGAMDLAPSVTPAPD
jgi:hypothetical protein